MTVTTTTTVIVTVAPGLWSSPDLLRRLKTYARRPAADLAVTDDQWYDFMTEAQAEVFEDIYSRFPDYQYSEAITLTTADGGHTYTFGLDPDGDPIYPMGYTEIYPNVQSIPDSPLTLGVDLELEGFLLRVPNGKTRTWVGGPVARFVSRPDVAVSATANPILFPKEHRILLIWKALESWASRPGSGVDPTYYAAKYDKALTRAWTSIATAYNRSGPHHLKWWSGVDFAVGGGLNL